MSDTPQIHAHIDRWVAAVPIRNGAAKGEENAKEKVTFHVIGIKTLSAYALLLLVSQPQQLLLLHI